MIDVEAIRKRKTIAERKISDCAVDVPIALSLTDIDNLLDEITRLQALVEWRTDWENAPDNGTIIEVYRPDSGVFLAHFVEEDAYLATPENPPEGDFYWFSTCGEDLTGDMPTHYRLITPPTADEPKEQL